MKRAMIQYVKKIKCDTIIKQYKRINFDNMTRENIKEHNPNCPQIPDHPR